jgi:glutamyl-Q tRNA(Asp) synthetase
VAHYVGRFAPSPTGPLHFGSLVAAVGSYLQARSNRGRWLVRIEDLDPPRELAGAARDILTTLERFGFAWDGPILYQSARDTYYRDALARLAERGAIYECACSRKDTAAAMPATDPASVYSGRCRSGVRAAGVPTAVRVRVQPAVVEVADGLQGPFAQRLDRDVGDFVVRRRDGWYAYQLATVVDDHLQGVTEVVRGCDLLHSTPRQWYLQQLLDYAHPDYVHLPVALDARGQKLSKQTGAEPISRTAPSRALHAALEFLEQSPPPDLAEESRLEPVWSWAVQNWRPQTLNGIRSRRVGEAVFARGSDGN